jgi:hypothetical protein
MAGGRDVQMDYRRTAGDAERTRRERDFHALRCANNAGNEAASSKYAF